MTLPGLNGRELERRSGYFKSVVGLVANLKLRVICPILYTRE